MIFLEIFNEHELEESILRLDIMLNAQKNKDETSKLNPGIGQLPSPPNI